MESLNIYCEALISKKNNREIWEQLFSHKQFSSLFQGKQKFTTNEEGELFWKIFIFKKIKGNYFVQSFVPEQHLMMDIKGDGFTSTLLITLENSDNTLILRLDHRSFIGKAKKKYYSRFMKRWNNVFKSFIPKKEK